MYYERNATLKCEWWRLMMRNSTLKREWRWFYEIHPTLNREWRRLRIIFSKKSNPKTWMTTIYNDFMREIQRWNMNDDDLRWFYQRNPTLKREWRRFTMILSVKSNPETWITMILWEKSNPKTWITTIYDDKMREIQPCNVNCDVKRWFHERNLTLKCE